MKKLMLLCSTLGMLLLSATMAMASATIKIGGLFAVTGPASFLGEPESAPLRCWWLKPTPRVESTARSWRR